MLITTLLLACAAAVSARQCKNVTIPVSISARNGAFDIATPTTEIDVTDFFLHNSYQGGNYTASILTGYNTISGTYKLAATYCHPDSGPGKTLQVLTHGVGFDKSYWDLSFNNGNYSYVARAVDQFGYSTLSWDRLGIGHSQHGDPLNEIQAALEIAALHELTTLLADGHACGIKKAYADIVHVGHSFGSVLTYNLANYWPESTRAIVLTGFSQVPAYLGEFALGAGFVPVKMVPALAKEYAPGYYAPQSQVGVQQNFFAPGDFDPKILKLATMTGQPFSAGEALTVAEGTGVVNAYDGPVLIISGDMDIPFCGGNCSSTMALPPNSGFPNLLEFSSTMFPKASCFNATIVPGAGHGLNLQYTHPFTYTTILDFLEAHN